MRRVNPFGLVRLAGAGAIVCSMVLGAVNAGPHLALPVGAAALSFALGLTMRNAWAPALLATIGGAITSGEGAAHGAGLGLTVGALLQLAVVLITPVLRKD